MSAYVQQLNRQVTRNIPAPINLRSRFVDWFNALPEVTRARPFSMQEFEAALGTQGKYMSAVLLGLGWKRKRKWDSRGRYPRYWVPPK